MTKDCPNNSRPFLPVNPSRRDILFWTVFALFFALQMWQHISASYALPIPWPDESHFLWQAVAFSENGSFFAPQINPERAVFWMPPGFMVAVGLWLKIFGLSLGIARTFSFVMLALSFLALAALLRQQRLPLLSLVVAGIIYLNGPFAACGNNARPEAMLLCFIFCGFLLISHRHGWKGLALLALTPLIHPNGIYFVAGAIIYLVASRRLSADFKKMSKFDLASLVIFALLWLAYLFYVVSNWSDFAHDMTFQIEHKSGRDIRSRLINPQSVISLLVVAAACWYLARQKISWGLLIAIGLPAWLAYQIGFEMWYDVLWGIGWISLSLTILYAAYHVIIERALAGHVAFNWTLFAAVLVLVTYWNHYADTVQAVHAYPDRMAWHGLRFPDDNVAYITDDDRATLTHLIDSLCLADDLKTIQFLPRADAFLLPKIAGNRNLLVSHPLFCRRKPDLYVFHRSRYQPRKWGTYEIDDLKEIFEV
ncbi:MAG: hypothetical protein JSU65_07740, partial [Candidatus Zixiibacteriota bacterium]